MRRTRGASRSSRPTGRSAGDRQPAVLLRQVARPDLDARGGPPRPGPRSRWRDPDAALDRPLLHLSRDLRLHAVLRRPRRARGDAGSADGRRRRGDHGHAPVAGIARSTVPLGCRRTETRRDGAVAARSGRRGPVPGARRDATLRRAGKPALSGEARGERVALVATVLLAIATVAT